MLPLWGAPTMCMLLKPEAMVSTVKATVQVKVQKHSEVKEESLLGRPHLM